MLTMDKINDIRLRFFTKGENISQIANALQLDWRTVQKYVDMKDFNEPVPKPASEHRFCPKLEPFVIVNKKVPKMAEKSIHFEVKFKDKYSTTFRFTHPRRPQGRSDSPSDVRRHGLMRVFSFKKSHTSSQKRNQGGKLSRGEHKEQ